jgi:selenide, water dikinase
LHCRQDLDTVGSRANDADTAPLLRASTGRLLSASGTEDALDQTLWVSAAGAAPWLASSELRLDTQGFIAVNDRLQSGSHSAVCSSGDIGSVEDHPRPKSGVFAVRQGRPLADNLRRALQGRPLRPFRPLRRFLSLTIRVPWPRAATGRRKAG